VLSDYNDAVEQLAINCNLLVGAAQAKDPQVIKEAKANLDKLTHLVLKASLQFRKKVIT
jgi:hypothetical protein